MTPTLAATLQAHVADSARALASVADQAATLAAWGSSVAATLTAGGRLLAAGNGGSAAEAQHLTAELVGRYQSDRRPFSAIALHADTSAITAIGNDYGFESVFSRQVEGHGRRGDVLVLLSTSGRSPNLVAAAESGRRLGMRVLGFTGPAPNPLAEVCSEVLAIDCPRAAAVQEAHLVAVHLLCTALDAAVASELQVLP